MNILGIVCSPRNKGNTEILVSEALKTARESGCETDIFLTAGRTISPCLACGTCFKDGECIQKDDMQVLYKLMIKADGIILGSPVYFHNVSAQAKAVMDRTFAFLKNQSLKNKIAAAIITTRRIGGSQTRALVYDYFLAHGMIVVGGALGYGPNPGDVLTGVGGGINMTAMDEARLVAKSMIDMANHLRSR